ncbi:hypothetical protein PRZ48_005584 [Zasmidium cellare]|uniref:Aminoglycoside phosphotransferase domain-containing protein n=1 Tax=Zasmidium cellare TaxID=395010 RepID=A0ABR0EKY0_ZASCE|nr:hypothetical protein PRZ48_005584 [Zasmidium cellare]
MACVYVDATQLPSGDNCDLGSPGIELPSPEQVLSRATREGIDTTRTFRPDPVRFQELGIIVKWGEDVTVAEGQCVWFLRKHFKGQVPVPAIHGWRQHNGVTFLYLQLVSGTPMATLWGDLAEHERSSVCNQLRGMIQTWRRLKPAPKDPGYFWRLVSTVLGLCGIESGALPNPEHQLSAITGGALRDVVFYDAGAYPAGPFQTVREFHDALAGLIARGSTDTNLLDRRKRCPELEGLADDTPITFTHADLDLSNILLSDPQDGPVRIVAIIDWHQAGWYPEPWERLKAHSVAGHGSEWATKYLDTVLDPAPYEYFYAFEYISMSTI